jgi:oxygen-independent coproporphyrinogen-3 oxidase
MYEIAIERLEDSGLQQYEISNFARDGHQSRHNLRYWQRRPYLGVGLDASSMLQEESHVAAGGFVLRSTTTDDLKAYLAGSQTSETAWLSPERRHEEAWFLGLRLNEGVEVSAVRNEFGNEPLARALEVVERLVESGLLVSDAKNVRLTSRGRMLSNEVFQDFLESGSDEVLTAGAREVL